MESKWRQNVWTWGVGYRGVLKCALCLLLPGGIDLGEPTLLVEVKADGLRWWEALFLNSEPYAPLAWVIGPPVPDSEPFPFGAITEPDHPPP